MQVNLSSNRMHRNGLQSTPVSRMQIVIKKVQLECLYVKQGRMCLLSWKLSETLIVKVLVFQFYLLVLIRSKYIDTIIHELNIEEKDG